MKITEAWKEFSQEVSNRLSDKDAEGYTGWDGGYPEERLKRELTDDALDLESGGSRDKTIYLDIAARAMMLHYRFSR